MKTALRIGIGIWMLLSLLGGSPAQGQSQAAWTSCRFGITDPLSSGVDTDAQLAALRVGWYLNWGSTPPADLPQSVSYLHVLRVRDDLYAAQKAALPALLAAYPGAYWEVGNEPDTTYENQDNLIPEVYAQRFYELAVLIRAQDPAARIGFGTVVQPTPIRIRYLQRAWNELIRLAGSQAAASDLVDFWNVHSFILNEIRNQWGTGVPPGFETDPARDAVSITNFADTYSITRFKKRIQDFRAWMKTIGEQDKPLWITEYGSLLPPMDPPGMDLVNVTDVLTAAFMVQTFDYLSQAVDAGTGMPDDGNHLVQKWFWYSLNDHRYKFGGSLYDPDAGQQPTLVGSTFSQYAQGLTLAPDLRLEELLAIRPIAGDEEHFELTLKVRNVGSADRAQGTDFWLKRTAAEAPSAALQMNTAMSIYGCGEPAETITLLAPYVPGAGQLYVQADTRDDSNPADNRLLFTAPPVPANLSAGALSFQSVVLRWTAAAGADAYRLERRVGTGGAWAPVTDLDAAATTYQDAGLLPGGTYQYRLRAHTAAGWWGASPAVAVTLFACPPPAPANLHSMPTSSDLYLFWTGWKDAEYLIERSPAGENAWASVGSMTTTGEQASFRDASVPDGRWYDYRVRANVAGCGISPYSAVVSTHQQRFYTPLMTQ